MTVVTRATSISNTFGDPSTRGERTHRPPRTDSNRGPPLATADDSLGRMIAAAAPTATAPTAAPPTAAPPSTLVAAPSSASSGPA